MASTTLRQMGNGTLSRVVTGKLTHTNMRINVLRDVQTLLNMLWEACAKATVRVATFLWQAIV